jgi:hypothetical protein
MSTIKNKVNEFLEQSETFSGLAWILLKDVREGVPDSVRDS